MHKGSSGDLPLDGGPPNVVEPRKTTPPYSNRSDD